MNVEKISIRHDKLVGTFYSLPNLEKKPGIILLSGSDGGIPGENAIPEVFIEFLTRNGFAVLALAYFGAENLSPHLENIPLEYFESAIEWLKAQTQVNASSIGIIGQSRGAELALLLGHHFPQLIQAIVACVPCNMICGGFPYPNHPAWTFRNLPLLPFLSGFINADIGLTEAEDLKQAMEREAIPYHANTQEDPCMIADLFDVRLGKPEAQKAEMPVENLKCPLLLMSGEKDSIWPSQVFCELIMKRLEKHHWKYFKQHVNYTHAGHGILSSYNGPIYHPVGQFWCKLGGTLEGNQIANENSWIAIIEFLQKTLSSDSTTQ